MYFLLDIKYLKKVKIIVFVLPIILSSFYSCICKATNSSNELEEAIQLSSVSGDTLTYLFKNDTIIQSAKILFHEDSVDFIVETNNIKRNISSKIKGVAIKLTSENAAIIVDEEEFAHFADVYQYKLKDCWLYIYIDNEEYNKISITANQECNFQTYYWAPFESIGLLKKE